MANYILVFPEAIKRKKAWTHYIRLIQWPKKPLISTSEKEMLMVSTLIKFEEEPTAIKPMAGT